MYQFNALLLYPSCNYYAVTSTAQELHTFNTRYNLLLRSYDTEADLCELIQQHCSDYYIRFVIIVDESISPMPLKQYFASDFHFQSNNIPSHINFYARLMQSIHLLSVSPSANNISLLMNQISEYAELTAPQALYALAKQAGHLLLEHQLTISTAESCSGGLIGKSLTDIAGSSAYFAGSTCTYQASAKINILHVPKDVICTYGIVSSETAHAMAIGAQTIFQSDVALSTTGVAGPGPDSDGNPEGFVCVGLSINNRHYTFHYHASAHSPFTDRNFIRIHCVIFALQQLINALNQ